MLLALAAGLLTNLAFEPVGFFPVAFFTLALLFWLWSPVSPGRAALLGFAFGVGFYGLGIHWIYISVHEFGSALPILAGAAVVLLACIMSALVALSGYLQAKFRTSDTWHYLAMIPALWVLTEWVRGWLFTGFPWLYIGYSQTGSWLSGWAPILGVLGVSFAVCTIAGALALILVRRSAILPAVAIAAVSFAGFIGERIDWASESHSPIKVAIIQGDVSVLEKWDQENAVKLLNYFVTESRTLADNDLVLWPEIALPYRDTRLEKLRLWELLEEIPADFLIGTLEEQAEGDITNYYNSAYGITDDGVQKYRKSRLVPFGEYTPLRNLLGWLSDYVILPASDMTEYGTPQAPLRLAGQPAGVSICYEDAFPEDILKMLPDASYLINISEDAWFGDRLAPHQRLQMSQMRAIETARPVVRAANKGISVSIDHRGRVIDQLSQSEGMILRTSIVPTSGTTPFARFGFTPILVLCAALIALSIAATRKNRAD